jgi:hypothetical protein
MPSVNVNCKSQSVAALRAIAKIWSQVGPGQSSILYRALNVSAETDELQHRYKIVITEPMLALDLARLKQLAELWGSLTIDQQQGLLLDCELAAATQRYAGSRTLQATAVGVS